MSLRRRYKGSTRAELSRWAYGSPGWVEDTNLVGVAEFLNWPRYVVGVDDMLFGGAQLRLAPRLPSRWKHCGVNDWPVQFVGDHGPSGVDLCVRTEDPVRGLRVRLGPFPEGSEPGLDLGSHGSPVVVRNSGGSLWLWVAVGVAGQWARVEACAVRQQRWAVRCRAR